MLTRILGTTAAIAMLSTVSFAQTTPELQETTPPAPALTSDLFTYPPEVAPKSGNNLVPASGKVLASGMIGQAVYDGPGSDAKSIGHINDIVIGENGVAQAAVIGVGGFLGVGEKDVAVGLDRVDLATRPDGEHWLVTDVSKDDLNNAPAFERSKLFTRGIINPDKAASAADGTGGSGVNNAPMQQ